MGLAHSPSIVTSGLAFCLDAANTKSYPGSGTTWTDLSGNGRNGTLTNGPTYSSSNGGSIVLDGTDDYINISNSVDAKTILAFVRPTTAGGDYVVYGLDANGSDNWLGINSNLVNMFATQSGDLNNFILLGTTTITVNTWCQIGGIIDGTTAKVFLNGKEENTVTKAFTIGAWNTNPTLGRRGSIAQRYFPGNIANIQVYNRVLTAAEVAQNFQALRGRYGL